VYLLGFSNPIENDVHVLGCGGEWGRGALVNARAGSTGAGKQRLFPISDEQTRLIIPFGARETSPTPLVAEPNDKPRRFIHHLFSSPPSSSSSYIFFFLSFTYGQKCLEGLWRSLMKFLVVGRLQCRPSHQ
jgi:hypothetical protein